MNARGVVVGVLACLALAGCGESTGGASHGEPFTLPVGPTEWDVSAPAWFHDGTLHVGERTVELGDRVGQFVLGATGVYWMRGLTLMFTSAEGDTQEVEDVGWVNLAVSANRSVFATVDQSRGRPTSTAPTSSSWQRSTLARGSSSTALLMRSRTAAIWPSCTARSCRCCTG